MVDLVLCRYTWDSSAEKSQMLARRLARRGLGTTAAAAAAAGSGQYDVLINGGGIVGAVFAVSLLRQVGKSSGLRIGIVDPRPPPSLESCLARATPDVRVYAMSPRSIETLEAVGAWKHVVARSQPYDSMQVWESTGPGLLRFSAPGADESAATPPYLGCIVEDSTVQAAVYRALEEENGAGAVDFLFGQSVTGLQVQRDAELGSAHHLALVTLSSTGGAAVAAAAAATTTTQVRARLVVGADGAASAVRRLSGGSTWGWSYGQEALVATVRVAAPHRTAWQRYLPAGLPLALLPLWGDLSSIVWSLPVAEARRLSALPPQEFLVALNEALQAPPRTDRWSVLEPGDAPYPRAIREIASLADAVMSAAAASATGAASFQSPPAITEIVSARVGFPLQLQQAGCYTSPRVALVGDAAHSIHPQAGQGLNLGIADARVLASTVAGALEAGGDIGDPVLLQREYGAPQYAANLAMMGAVDGLGRVFALGGGGGGGGWRGGRLPRVLQMLRGAGMLAINALGPVKSRIAARAMGVDSGSGVGKR